MRVQHITVNISLRAVFPITGTVRIFAIVSFPAPGVEAAPLFLGPPGVHITKGLVNEAEVQTIQINQFPVWEPGEFPIPRTSIFTAFQGVDMTAAGQLDP